MSTSSNLDNEAVGSNGPKLRDEGSVLPMILGLMVVGSLGVVALLTFATTLFINRPPIEVRDQTFWTAKSAMSMAMTLQRENGPDGCYPGPYDFTLNGFTANVTCTPTGNYFGTGRGRFALITTGNGFQTEPLVGNGPGAAVKPLVGDVLFNAGSFDDSGADIGVQASTTGVLANVLTSNFTSVATPTARYNDPTVVPTVPPAPPAVPVATDCNNPAITPTMAFPGPGAAWSPTCQAQPWWELAGDLNSASTYDYPELPPLPAYLRPSVPQATVGSCNVYFPGRYPAALTLGAGDHFFPSGVFYFENTVTLAPGARVVAGEGRWSGCTFDAEAAFAPTAPSFHAITGKGATFVLGGNARIVSNDASLRINRRVSDSTSRGTETVAIRSVNFTSAVPTAPTAVEIPNDIVYLADLYDSANSACNASLSTTTCLQRAADHSVRPTASAPIATYTASTRTPSNEIISINQSSGTAASNQFVTDGYIFVPNSKVSFSGGANTDYRLRISAGIVASSAQFAYAAMPSNTANWFVGVLDEPIQRQVELFASVTAPNGQRTESRAIMEINIDESYAINGWTVDPNVSGPTPPPTTAATTTTTTVPSATTTVPEVTTTTTIPAPTTTLPPVIPPVPGGGTTNCNSVTSNPQGWSQDFGPGTWAAEYWNWGSPRPNFSSSTPFAGSPTQTGTVATLAACLNASPSTGVQADNFSARFTKTWTTTEARDVTFLAGGDDGYRVSVNGTRIVDNWDDHAHEWSTQTVTLPAGTHTIVFEFYENGGFNSWQLWRN
jgi:hypothetical protein